ncbi:MAG: hypothetical protein QW397_00325 [Fervidicoccaceae archaeon]
MEEETFFSNYEEKSMEPFSLLFLEENSLRDVAEPGFFRDLLLDIAVNEIARDDEDLRKLFYILLKRKEEILYRQEIFRDLENDEILSIIKNFQSKMKEILRFRKYQEEQYEYQREGIFIENVETYCNAITELAEGLSRVSLASEGLRKFSKFIQLYVNSPGFNELKKKAQSISKKLTSLNFSITIKGDKVIVRKYEGEMEYTNEIRIAFRKFENETETEDVFKSWKKYPGYYNHIEANILHLLAIIYKEEFNELKLFYKNYKNFIHPMILKFFAEMNFYLSYLDYIEPLKKIGMHFSLPELVESAEEVSAENTFDVVLAKKQLEQGKRTVVNDFHFEPGKRIIVVTGPNSGGKTTFARAIGQIHALGLLGLPVPGSKVKILLADGIFTHFERIERVENLRGKLEDELMRIKNILNSITDRSVIILNEMLSSTTVYDATSIGREVLKKIIEKGSLCVFVTFIDELARMDGVKSMVAQVDPKDPSIRTFKIVPQEPSSAAYAYALARKYGLSKEIIRARLRK